MTMAVGALFVASAPVAPVRAGETKPAAVSDRTLAAKIEYCKTCHGLSAQGFRGATTMPRLAGQTVEYIEGELTAFIERRRASRFMYNVARVLSPDMRAALATHFSGLRAPPLRGGPREFTAEDLVAEGRTIFEEGVPARDVPPCVSCHGQGAKGEGAFPRLAGQPNDYIVAKLTNWEEERGLDPSTPDVSITMLPIVRGLNPSQMRAVAAYLSELDP
jgi:cytochrome c553